MNGQCRSQERTLAGVHVLVVDNDADEREMLAFVFNMHGARVTAVGSAAEALAAARNGRPDVLVSDVLLPERDGYSLVRELRTWPPPEGGRIPAVAVTGCCQEGDRTEAIDAGFQVHLGKPVPLETLLEVVAKLARVSRAAV